MTSSGQRRGPVLREGRHWTVDPVTGCWEWQLFKLRGYGRTATGQAHRAVWRQAGRPLADGEDLHHRCHKPGCVNPDHMQIAHRSQHLKHHKRACSPLTVDQIVEIRSSLLPHREIAHYYGVSVSVIDSICAGHNWRGIGPTRPDVRCPICGEQITTGHRNRRYCSPAHRNTAYVRRRREKGIK